MNSTAVGFRFHVKRLFVNVHSAFSSSPSPKWLNLGYTLPTRNTKTPVIVTLTNDV